MSAADRERSNGPHAKRESRGCRRKTYRKGAKTRRHRVPSLCAFASLRFTSFETKDPMPSGEIAKCRRRRGAPVWAPFFRGMVAVAGGHVGPPLRQMSNPGEAPHAKRWFGGGHVPMIGRRPVAGAAPMTFRDNQSRRGRVGGET